MSTHTPGPWKFEDSPAWGYSILWNPETRQEILVPDGRNDADRPETWMGEELSDADRALIEAAPDLLVRLQHLVNEVSGQWSAFEDGIRAEIGNTNYRCVAYKIDAARAIIAKAIGGQHEQV